MSFDGPRGHIDHVTNRQWQSVSWEYLQLWMGLHRCESNTCDKKSPSFDTCSEFNEQVSNDELACILDDDNINCTVVVVRGGGSNGQLLDTFLVGTSTRPVFGCAIVPIDTSQITSGVMNGVNLAVADCVQQRSAFAVTKKCTQRP